MKKLFILLVLIAQFASAQNWKTGGNNVLPGQWFGSNNPVGLSFRANNIERLNISSLGNVNVTGTFSINGLPIIPSLIDSVSVAKGSNSATYSNWRLMEWKNGVGKIRTYLAPYDDNDNLFMGSNDIFNNSIDNIVNGNNINLSNSHGNIINANNLTLVDVSKALIQGADHFVFPGAYYSVTLNDFNKQAGASGLVFGFGNEQGDENGVCGGSECTNGNILSQNENYSTWCFGYRSHNRGDCSITNGTYLKTLKNYVLHLGFGEEDAGIYSEVEHDEVVAISNGSRTPSLYLFKATDPDHHGTWEVKGLNQLDSVPEFSDNTTAYAVVGDRKVYRTAVGDEWVLKLSHEPNSQFQFAQQENINQDIFKNAVQSESTLMTYDEAIQLKGTWYFINGQKVKSLNIGLFILVNGNKCRKVVIHSNQ